MTRSLAASRRAEATALRSWITPQLTKLVDQPPDGSEWLHEIATCSNLAARAGGLSFAARAAAARLSY